MVDNYLSSSDTVYVACCDTDYQKFKETIKSSDIERVDSDGDTLLHIASRNGSVDMVRLLLRYHASPNKRNAQGQTPVQVAADEETSETFLMKVRPPSDAGYYNSPEPNVEWIDTYKNAYRIAYENNEHMRRWLLKIPLEKLLIELKTGYIDKLYPENPTARRTIQEHFGVVIEFEDPLGLLLAYTTPQTNFFTLLNTGLATVGSDFRFVSVQNLFRSGYLDNEPPKDLGEHIFAAIVMNHSRFHKYFHTGKSYRGMSITPTDLAQYKTQSIVMTRSFLSTSEDREIAELFLDFAKENCVPVLCIYDVKNRRSSLGIAEISQISDEKEVLIVPFVVFQIKARREIRFTREEKTYLLTEIDLEEFNTLPT